MVSFLPHTQFAGMNGGCHPFSRQESVSAPLCRAKPCVVIGRADNQLDAPFSLQASRVLTWCSTEVLSCSPGLIVAELPFKKVQDPYTPSFRLAHHWLYIVLLLHGVVCAIH